ncbi:MAG: hypothetical protein LBV07_04945, partial [Syntrophobacterales bacterium]|nr:hypothetical protein [Syntrophobacterales bacterium]
MNQGTSFTERAKQFWRWFSANEEKLSDIVQNRNHSDNGEAAVAFISEGVSLLAEELHFNIGGDHEFTFSVDGKYALFFLLPYVTANLPEQYRDKWNFFPCMQGTGGHNFGFRMYGTNVNTDHVMVSAAPDEESKTADLRFYIKEWESLEEKDSYNAFYTLLDLSIGEALAHVCLNNVEKAEILEEGMFPLTELEQWMIDNLCEDGKIPDPAERYFGYEKTPPDEEAAGDDLPRQDIFVGIAKYTPLLSCYDDGEDDCYQKFTDFGAKPVFLYYFYDNEADRNDILNERNDLMDKLEEEVLGKLGSGRETGLLLGGAMGENCAYIDLLLYDEEAFMEKAKTFLSSSPYMIFGKEFYRDGREFLLTDHAVSGFTERLQQLHEVDAHGEIIKIIEALPDDKRDFDLTNLYARALNNTGQEEKTLEVLESVREKGENDALWNWRYGYALYYTGRKAESIPCLEKAIALGDDHPETAELLEMARAYQAKIELEAKRRAAKIPRDPNKVPFEDFDFTNFWDNSDYALEEYVGTPPANEQFA